jgi:tripartite-type tricarboxylate transporter receptor subunit TctC
MRQALNHIQEIHHLIERKYFFIASNNTDSMQSNDLQGKQMLKKIKLISLFAGIALSFYSYSQPTERFPSKPIRVVIPFPAAGALDSAARAIGEPLGEKLKQTIILENKPGAGSRLGTEIVANAPGDGYTILIATPASTTMAPLLVSSLNYSPEKDLLPLMRVAEIVNIMVVPTSRNINSVNEFLTWAKNRKEPIRYGSSGVGSADHLVAEFFKQTTGLDLVHVPYKGGGPAMIDLASGDIDVSFTTYAAASAVLSSGKIKALAVLTSSRQQFLPNLPAINESIPGLSISNWAGFFTPKNTPLSIREKLFKEIAEVSKSPDVRAKANRAGLEISLSSSIAEFDKDLKDEKRRWSKIIKDANITAE